MKTLITTILIITQISWSDNYPTIINNGGSHVTISMLATVFANDFLYDAFKLSKKNRILTSAILGMSLGVYKEYVDYYTGGYFSTPDLICDGAGTALGVVFIIKFSIY